MPPNFVTEMIFKRFVVRNGETDHNNLTKSPDGQAQTQEKAIMGFLIETIGLPGFGRVKRSRWEFGPINRRGAGGVLQKTRKSAKSAIQKKNY